MTELWSRVCGPVFWPTLYVIFITITNSQKTDKKNKITQRTKKNKGTKGTRTETQLNVVSCVMRTRTRAIGNGNVPKIVTDNPINYFFN